MTKPMKKKGSFFERRLEKQRAWFKARMAKVRRQLLWLTADNTKLRKGNAKALKRARGREQSAKRTNARRLLKIEKLQARIKELEDGKNQSS